MSDMIWFLFLFVGLCSAQYSTPLEERRPAQQATYPYEGSTYLSSGIDRESPPITGGDILSETSSVELPKDSRISIQDGRLQYTHGFSDGNSGTSVSEQGSLLSTNDGWEYVIVKKGSYSYISPEGIPIKVNYIADHNGFRLI